jgi:hypothetical protein
MRINLPPLTFAAAMFGIAGALQAQDLPLPTMQPKYLHIVREEVKPGRNADHAKIEAGWPAAYERAKSSDYYLAMVAMTGVNETWFLAPQESNAAVDAMAQHDAADQQLQSELERLRKADAELLTNYRVMQAVARPDLSYGTYPNLAKQRFWEITWFRVRPGHEQQWESAAKTYIATTKRAAPDASFQMYQIVAGVPGPTFLVVSSVESYADFDRVMSDDQKTWMAMTAEEMASMQKFSADGLINSETNRFRLSPVMSHVPKSVRQSDPSFWMPKKSTVASNRQVANTQP